MEAAHFSEKMVPLYHTAGRHILEGSSKIKDPDMIMNGQGAETRKARLLRIWRHSGEAEENYDQNHK